MAKSPCSSEDSVINRGAWTAYEDMILSEYITIHGAQEWRSLPIKAGLKRCGRSCRMRWLNYLRPDIKRGNISADEDELIIRLHRLLGNRWSLIAGRLPGRTGNEIKNHWNTHLRKKSLSHKPPLPKPNTKSNLTPVMATAVRLSKNYDKYFNSDRQDFNSTKESGFNNLAPENISAQLSKHCTENKSDESGSLLYFNQVQPADSELFSFPYYTLEDFRIEEIVTRPGNELEGLYLLGEQGEFFGGNA
ncbi:hypothetical protein SUGI_1002860 [Cryptomeria japonica]|nr:hypothetical protein SUGI_1002860 [Cryptomeria japonica]